MAMNIEQRLEQSAKSIEQSSQKAHDFAEKDTTLQTCAGSRDSLPKVSRIWQENFARQFNKHATEFQDRFALSQQSLPWQAGITISDSLQRYHVGVQGEEGYKEFLPNPLKLPFETAATLQDDLTQDRWLENGVPNKHWTESKVTSALEKSLGVNARIWPKDRDLQVGDVIPSAQETADGLPITHLVVNGNVYAMSPATSGLVSNFTNVSATIGFLQVDLIDLALRRQMGYIDAWGCQSGVLNDVAFQNAIDNCSHLRLPKGEWLYKRIKLRSNLVIEGEDNVNCILKQVQPTDTQMGGFYKGAGENLKNVQFIGFAYDGQRKANPTSPYNHMCYIELNGDEVVENILAYRLDAKNAQEDFINVTSYSNTARGKNIKAVLCKFSTDEDKISLPGNPVPSSGNGLRVWNRADPNTSYGIPVFTDVGTLGCEGERIRTVSDFKRGVKTFSISNNETVNCHDCHHSFDGAFDGTVSGNVGRNEPDFTLGARPNMIEGQGENVVISSNEFDGGLVTLSMINITDYGMPEEGDGTTITNVGHRSVNISVIGNNGRNVNQNMFNGINNLNCQWLNNTAKSAVEHGFAQSSGVARNDSATGLPLKASGNKYIGNSEFGVGLPLSIRNAVGTILGSNTDEYGNESLYLGGGDTLLVPASEFAQFKREATADNFNPNPQLKLDAAGTGILDWVCPRVVTLASTKPVGATNAVTITDDSVTANLEHVVNAFYEAEQNEIVYISLHIKRNTAAACGVLVQEYDVSGAFIASYFKTLTSTPVNWTKYITRHKVVSPNCASLRIGVLPAAAYNNPPSVGKTDIALVYIGRTPA